MIICIVLNVFRVFVFLTTMMYTVPHHFHIELAVKANHKANYKFALWNNRTLVFFKKKKKRKRNVRDT